MKTVIISGMPIVLQERSKAQMKGISIGDSLSYRFYDGDFHGIPLLFAEPKGKTATPRSLALTANALHDKFGLPVVYLLGDCPAYERQRLIDKDVYFIVSEKYAHLPMLIANERIRKTKRAKVLTPVAQYLLLYHLQIESLEGKAARDIESKVPYSYPSITLGITCLADLGLCQKVSDGTKRKVLHFNERGQQLWDKVQSLLINPVEERIYCDDLLSENHHPTCGINAFAMTGTVVRPRATHDIDMIVIVEKMTVQFAEHFWQFIREGGYRPERRRQTEGEVPKYELYRFVDGKPGYPAMIELLSRHLDICRLCCSHCPESPCIPKPLTR